MNRIRLCVFIVTLSVSATAFSQVSSPYSSNGIGEISFQGLPHNFAMGGVGIGTPSTRNINLENPALLTYNTLSSFQVGILGDFRKLNTTVESNKESSLGLRYLALSFPLISRSRWVTSIAALPLGTVNYHTVSKEPIDDIYTSQTDYFGDGGLSQLIWANGFRVFDNLSLGFRASYVFGTVTDESTIKLLLDSTGTISGQDFIIAYQETTSYSDFNLSVGAAYHVKLKEDKYLNLGATYSISNELSGSRDIFFERQTLNGISVDQQEISTNESANFELPITVGFGISYEKLAHYKVGLDIRTQRWSETSTQEPGEIFRNASSLSLGAEYTPNYQNVKNYFARAKYRLGFSYKESPYILNDKKINDFGINFGLALPMINASSLDLGFKFGVKGTTKNDLIRENYFQFVLGATMNDRWFIKRRYD
ncbi:MAG: hypothetical protein JXR03_14185 [Cyclobacteriaceae bacterium]